MAKIDFFFFMGSTYTYLTVMRLDEAAARAGAAVRWRPFNVRAIMADIGNSPFIGKPIKERYMWRDVERRAAKLGVPFSGKAPYPVEADLLASRVAIVAAQDGFCIDYVRASFQAWFLNGEIVGEEAQTRAAIEACGRDCDAIMARANEKAAYDALEAETEAARKAGVFGSPSFVVDGELFWGDDRLEDALAYAQG